MKSFLRISSLFAAVFLAGCRLHAPLPVTPPEPLPESFTHQTGVDSATELIEPWWQQFNDPALNRLEETLIADNLQIRQAYARLAQLEAAGRVAGSPLSPSLSLTGSANKASQKTETTRLASNGQSVSLAASYELDLWHKLRSNRDAAKLDFSASREEIKTLYLSLTSQAADLYFLAIEQQAQLELTNAIIKDLTTLGEQVEFRYRQGVAPRLDLYLAEQNLAAAKTKKPEQEAQLTATRNGLAVLLGHYPETGSPEIAEQLPVAPPAPAAGIPARLLQQRPDVQSAFLRVQSSDAKTAAAIADRFPALNLSGVLTGSRTDSGLTITHATFWNLIVGLTQPLFDGGRRRAEIERRQAVTTEALARYRQVVLNAFQEVENSLVANQAAEQQLALKNTELNVAGATLRHATNGYQQGLNDYLVVLNAQRQQHEVSRQYLASRRQLLSARITLWRALGGDWLETSLTDNLASQNQKDLRHEK